MRRVFLSLAFLGLLGVAFSLAAPVEPSRHVVLVVFDGMRPDFITAETAPNLWVLAQRGVFFKDHHAVYPSSTEVNGAAIATGGLPRSNGIVTNREFRPTFNPLRSFNTESPEYVEKGDRLRKGKYLALPTIAAQVQAAGFRTVVAGTKGVALLHDRAGGRRGETEPRSVNLYIAGTRESGEGLGGSEVFHATVMPDALAAVTEAVGTIPGRVTYPNEAQDAWTTGAVLDHLWNDGVPVFTTLWLSEPDFSQHQYSPGSQQALAAIRSSDRNLGRVVDALKERGLLDRTDILVASDHGFSTIERSNDVGALLRQAGFDAVREFKDAPQPGQIMVVGNSGTVCLFVIGGDPAVARRLVEHLQTTDYAGAIFAREKFDGAFTLGEGGLDAPDAPDVMFSLRWTDGKNQFGVPGLIYSDGRRPRGSGTHASLSRFEQHNTLVAAGPDFREGLVNEMPSGNIDLAPTILQVLGIKAAERVDGRVLREAMRGPFPPGAEAPRKVTERIERERTSATGRWRQYLQVTRYGGSFYLDEGDGAFEPK